MSSQSEWLTIYDSWKPDIELAGSQLTAKPVEIEVRFSDYIGGASRISGKNFDRLQSLGYTMKEEEISEIEYYANNIRKIGKTFQEKLEIGSVLGVEGIKLARSTEKSIAPIQAKATSKRTRFRRRFVTNFGFHLDLTEVREPVKEKKLAGAYYTKDLQIIYQMELEYTNKPGNPSKERWLKFFEETILLLRFLRDGLIANLRDYDLALNLAKNELVKLFPDVDSKKTDFDLNPDLLTKPRDLNKKDLIWGKLYGGYTEETSYSVTPKADGDRKLLYVSGTNIWLIGFGPQVKLVIRPISQLKNYGGTKEEFEQYLSRAKLFFDKYDGALLDGEEIPAQHWKPSQITPNSSKIWFLAFDMLKINKNYPITQQNLDARLYFLQTFKQEFAETFGQKFKLHLTTKAYYSLQTRPPFKQIGKFGLFEEEDPAQTFFVKMRQSVEDLNNLPYQTDGLIFTPRGSYHPTSSLQLLKWKPLTRLTIDLAVFPDRLTYGKDLVFTKFPLAPEERKKMGQIPEGAIAEFLPESGTLRYVGRRYNKAKPNSAKVVDSLVKLISDPIAAETLCGYNMKLAFYENNYNKNKLLKMVKPGAILLDIGSGKGGDLRKWRSFSKVYAVEPNPENAKEFRERLNALIKEDQAWREKIVLIEQGGEVDISEKVIPSNSVDAVSLMFCLTFFWEPSGNPVKLMGLLRNIQRVLKPDGKILFATMDGNAVDEYFSINSIGGLFKPKLGTKSRPIFGETLVPYGEVDPGGKDAELANEDKAFVRLRLIVKEKTICEIKPAENGQLYISIPESATITGQTESLVYLRDISALAPKFSLMKSWRSENRLLTGFQRIFCSFYMYGYLAANVKDQYILGSPSLTAPQVYAELEKRAQMQPPQVRTTLSQSLAPIAVIKPQIATQPAEGDDTREILDTEYLTTLRFNPTQNLPEYQWPSQEVSCFNNLNVVRVACISTQVVGQNLPDTVKTDNFFHALLKGILSDYSSIRNAAYDLRLQMAEAAKQLVYNFISSGEYTKHQILVYSQNQPAVRNGKAVKGDIVPFTTLYSRDLLLGIFGEYLQKESFLEAFFLPLISVLFRNHIVIFTAEAGKAKLSYFSTVNIPRSRGYDFAHTVVLLRFVSGNYHHYELLCQHDMARNFSLPVWSKDLPNLRQLEVDMVDSWNVDISRYEASQ